MMFRTFVAIITAVSLSVPIMAIPLQPVRRNMQSSYLPIPFDNYMGLSSLSGFDNFYGVNNFGGSSNEIVLQQTETVVCSQQEIEIIQQQLAVLVEFAKMILTTSICEVEVQTMYVIITISYLHIRTDTTNSVHSQFLSSVQSFSGDLLRQSGRSVGYDHSVASKIGQLHDSTGKLQNSNLGFSGSSVGSNYVSPSGSTWNNQTSPASAGSAFGLACAAGGLS